MENWSLFVFKKVSQKDISDEAICNSQPFAGLGKIWMVFLCIIWVICIAHISKLSSVNFRCLYLKPLAASLFHPHVPLEFIYYCEGTDFGTLFLANYSGESEKRAAANRLRAIEEKLPGAAWSRNCSDFNFRQEQFLVLFIHWIRAKNLVLLVRLILFQSPLLLALIYCCYGRAKKPPLLVRLILFQSPLLLTLIYCCYKYSKMNFLLLKTFWDGRVWCFHQHRFTPSILHY